jgi:pyridoxamine 5'-phosphate oxidase
MFLSPQRGPLEQFDLWMDEARRHKQIREPTATALATATAAAAPSVRMVLLKAWDEQGFVFYTNLGSQKAAELRENPRAALCIYWMPFGRQVRIDGPVEPVSDEEADAYFASRERQSRIGAWASKQSQPLESRHALEKRVAKVVARYPMGTIPRPEFWSGYRLRHETVEFWLEKPFRLHDRLRYRRTQDGWATEWLYP